jgi:predicted nicotinamide N-methyase
MTAVTDLSTLIVTEGGVPPERMDDALQRQVLSGGGLDTVLLEMGLVDEDHLLKLLSRSEGIPAVDRGAIDRADPAAVAMFPRRLAEKHGIVPLSVDARTLSVAVARKPDLALLDEIGFMLSVYVKPHVTTEARVAYALFKLYGVPLAPRVENLLGLLGEDPDDIQPIDAPPPAVNEEPAPDQSSDGWSVVSAKMAVTPSDGGADKVSGPATPAAEMLQSEAPAAPSNGTSQAEAEQGRRRLLEKLEAEEAAEAEYQENRRKHRVKWTVDDAIAELALADSRDAMLDVALRFAYRRLSTAAVFVLLRGGGGEDRIPGWVLWDVIDERFTRKDFERLFIPADEAGCLGQIREIRSHFLGPLKDGDPLVEAFGRAPRAAVLVPIIVGDVLAAVLYGDGGRRPIPPSSLAELHMVVPRLGKALRNLILRRKRQVSDEEVAETASAVAIAPRAEARDVPVIEVDLEDLDGDDEIDGAIDAMSAASAGSFAPAADEPAEEPTVAAPTVEAAAEAPVEPPPAATEAPAAEVSAPRASPPPLPKKDKAKTRSTPPISAAVWSPAPSPGADARESLLLATWRDWMKHETDDADELVGRLQAPGEQAREALTGLLAKKLDAMPSLSRYFPGVLAVHPFGNMAGRPPVAEFSDACTCLMRLGRDLAAPVLVGELDHDDRLHRYTALWALTELKVPAALPRIAQRVFDDESKIAHLALEVLDGYRDAPGWEQVIERVRDLCRRGDDFQRRRAVLAAAHLRDRGAFDALVHLLGIRPKEVAEHARSALVEITLQDFGLSERRWRAWLADNADTPRMRWLIEALSHKDAELRERAQEELTTLTGHSHGYRFDAPRRERDVARLVAGAARRPLVVSQDDVGYRTRSQTLALRGGDVHVLEVADVDAVLDRATAEGGVAPYGVVLWASGVALAEAVVSRPLQGRRVVDVGAGVGAASLAAAARGARVIALDHDPTALKLLSRAAAEHGLDVDARAFDLYEDVPLPDADLYLFADLLYEPELAVRCGERVLECAARGAEVLLADPDRASRGAFLACLADGGLDARFVDTWARVPTDSKPTRVGVLHLDAVAS